MAGLPLRGRDGDLLHRLIDEQRAFDWTSRPALVSVAAVQGHAIGAGFQLALGADLRILSSDASFSMAEATLGLVPDLTGTSTLVELVGYSRAVELCLTGRAVGAAEAVATGLANVAVPRDQLASYAARARAHPDGIVDLSVGTPVDPTPDVVRRALGRPERQVGMVGG